MEEPVNEKPRLKWQEILWPPVLEDPPLPMFTRPYLLRSQSQIEASAYSREDDGRFEIGHALKVRKNRER